MECNFQVWKNREENFSALWLTFIECSGGVEMRGGRGFCWRLGGWEGCSYEEYLKLMRGFLCSFGSGIEPINRVGNTEKVALYAIF